MLVGHYTGSQPVNWHFLDLGSRSFVPLFLQTSAGVSCIIHVCNICQARTVEVDVDVPNSDGVTAVMLAVRDIDLFEDMMTLLPWEHRPVEVVKELLGLSA